MFLFLLLFNVRKKEKRNKKEPWQFRLESIKPFWLHWASEIQVVPFLMSGEIQLKHSPFSDPKHVEHGNWHAEIIIERIFFFQKKGKVKTLANEICIRIIAIRTIH